MSKSIGVVVGIAALFVAGTASAQGMLPVLGGEIPGKCLLEQEPDFEQEIF